MPFQNWWSSDLRMVHRSAFLHTKQHDQKSRAYIQLRNSSNPMAVSMNIHYLAQCNELLDSICFQWVPQYQELVLFRSKEVDRYDALKTPDSKFFYTSSTMKSVEFKTQFWSLYLYAKFASNELLILYFICGPLCAHKPFTTLYLFVEQEFKHE